MQPFQVEIDGQRVEVLAGQPLLQAALAAGIYIPHLCSHPDLPPAQEIEFSAETFRGSQRLLSVPPAEKESEFHGCRLCLVEIKGRAMPESACRTEVAVGMQVRTQSPALQAERRKNLARILANHPHACINCAQKEGCSREPCSADVPVAQRCCDKFGHCELQDLAEYIGVPSDLPRYRPAQRSLLSHEPLIVRDYNLCIACMRCVRICRSVRGVDALSVVASNGEFSVGSRALSLADSGCKFCMACVEVCPTGALMDKEPRATTREAFLVPCQHACPAMTDVPRYVRLVGERRDAAAYAVIRERVPFPGVLGHVCYHPCEDACRRRPLNDPISICALKRFADEHGHADWRSNLKPATPSAKRVAVVGAGPAGLTCAYYLARKGHAVTVYEAQAAPGGMLRWGVPEFRLPRAVLQREIDLILTAGAELQTGVRLGTDLSLAEVRRSHAAVFLAVGLSQSKKLEIPGADREGVLWGLEFLRAVNAGQAIRMGRRLCVVGGGNVAMDVALAARRLGAGDIQLVCLESREEMPASPSEIQYVQEEGTRIHTRWGPRQILGNTAGVSGLELIRCTAVFDAQGAFRPTYDENVTTVLDADQVILAVGQVADSSFLSPQDPLREHFHGLLKVDPQTLATSVAGVFAGGDIASGPGSVIEAIAAGRRAAENIDRYLGGTGNVEERWLESETLSGWLGQEEGFAHRSRRPMPYRPPAARVRDSSVIELGLEEGTARVEAQRCLRCDLRRHISPVVHPPKLWVPLSAETLATVPACEGVFQLLDAQKQIILICGTANLRQDLEARREEQPEARYFNFEKHPMYTQRESELLQQFLQQHGRLPAGNEVLEDLF